jgi:hypothetical protein
VEDRSKGFTDRTGLGLGGSPEDPYAMGVGWKGSVRSERETLNGELSVILATK